MSKSRTSRDLLTADPSRRIDAAVAQAAEHIVSFGSQQNPILGTAFQFFRPLIHRELRRNFSPKARPDMTQMWRDAQQQQQMPPQQPKPPEERINRSTSDRAASLRVLGLGESATPEQIKEAYRAIAQVYHPDKWADKPQNLQDLAAELMREANAAYAFLGKGGTR